MVTELSENARDFLEDTSGQFTIDASGYSDRVHLVTPAPTNDLNAAGQVVREFLEERGFDVGTSYGVTDNARDGNRVYYRSDSGTGQFGVGNIDYAPLQNIVSDRDILGNHRSFDDMDYDAEGQGYAPSAILNTVVHIPEGVDAQELADELSRTIRDTNMASITEMLDLPKSLQSPDVCSIPIDAELSPPHVNGAVAGCEPSAPVR